MLSVHIVGELLGASGLSSLDGQEAFSVAHLLDLLSLHPSSSLSYFCKWRTVVEATPKSQQDSWKVIRGETRGQTQVHSATSGGSLAMPSFYRQSSDKNKRNLLPTMNTVWAHPIDLHLATVSLDVWNFWPQLEFQVWSLDEFHLETLCGSAVIPLPMTTNEYLLDVPLVLHEAKTFLGSVAQAVGLPFHEEKDSTGGSDEVVRSAGVLYLRLAVLSRAGNDKRRDSLPWLQ